MNNFMYTVLNADIPLICTGVSIVIHVKCVIRRSVIRVVLENINACTLVSALTPVKCVIKHSVDSYICEDINACILVSDLIPVKCVQRHTAIRAVL